MLPRLVLLLVLGLALAWTSMAGAAPCCVITAIDGRTGVVTAREGASGRTFQFTVNEANLLRSLKMGQPLEGDFRTQVVSLPGTPHRFRMVNIQAASPLPGSGPAPSAAGRKPATGGPPGSSAGSSTGTKPGGAVSLPATQPTVSEGTTAITIRGRPSPAGENADGLPDPPAKFPRALKPNLVGVQPGSRIVAAKDHPQAQQMLSAVGEALTKQQINVALLGGHKYMINDCLGIKASAGEFTLRLGKPSVRFEGLALLAQASIERIALNALSVRVRPSAPPNVCNFSKAFAVGGSASNVRFELRLGGPTLDVNQCRIATLGPVHTRWHIGGLNLKPLQNNLDEVAKEMIEDSLNVASSIFMNPVTGALEGVLDKVCESKVALYRRYMDQLGAGVSLVRLPNAYVEQLKNHYPKVNLGTVRFGYSSRQPAGNTTTDCHNIYSARKDFVDRLRNATLGGDPTLLHLLYHELRHTEQCTELGGRDPYAERWFRDLEISALTTNLNNPNYYRVLHDRMPMEKDADARADAVLKAVPTLKSSL